MKIERSENFLRISIAGGFFENCFLGVTILFSLYAVYQWIHYPEAWHRESFQGCLGAALTGTIGYLATFERASFEFNRNERAVQWKRRRIFKTASGTLRFEDITLVSAKSPVGDDRIPQRRVAIHTASQEIPLSVAYFSDASGEQLQLAEEIREFVGMTSQDRLMETVRHSVRQGNIPEAIRLLRQEKKISLEDAKNIVDEMR